MCLIAKDCLLTGQEQACTRITRLVGRLSPCRKWPNTQKNGCWVCWLRQASLLHSWQWFLFYFMLSLLSLAKESCVCHMMFFSCIIAMIGGLCFHTKWFPSFWAFSFTHQIFIHLTYPAQGSCKSWFADLDNWRQFLAIFSRRTYYIWVTVNYLNPRDFFSCSFWYKEGQDVISLP